MTEAPTVAIGSYRPEKLWSPVIDTTIAEEKRIPAFVPWISSYFNHGDLDSQKDEVLEYYVPALDRAPSVCYFFALASKLYIEAGILLGGFVCLGQFLHQFLAGAQIGYP